jgi:hypothetical protein
VRTLAIRLEEDQHSQLTMVAKLENLSVSDAIREAIDSWIDSKKSNPELQQRAEAILADMEREAASRRGAIAALLGDRASTDAPSERPASGRGHSTRGKSGDEASSES